MARDTWRSSDHSKEADMRSCDDYLKAGYKSNREYVLLTSNVHDGTF